MAQSQHVDGFTNQRKHPVFCFSFVVLCVVFLSCLSLTIRYDYHVMAGQAFQHHSNHWTLLTMCIFSPQLSLTQPVLDYNSSFESM